MLVVTAESSIAMSCLAVGRIADNQPLSLALVEHGVPMKIVNLISVNLNKVFDLRKLRPGDGYEVRYGSDTSFEYFELRRSRWERYIIKRGRDSILVLKDTIPLVKVVCAASGVVKHTLWESMIKAGVEPEAILRFTDVLAYDFDFVTDTRDGHKFKILYEKQYFGDEVVGVGRVLAAMYETRKKKLVAIYYEDPDGRAGYFDLAGKSMKKSLLKAPLNYRRISSHFSTHRFHPILKRYLPHLGVDYVAPKGTPVVSSGNGVVVFAGWARGFGNFIRIKHDNGIETSYGHLSRFARGIRKGVRVRRGQVIGYVGATGLATGPHLDYRVKVKGKYVNPEKYAFPAEPPVKRKYMENYRKYANSVLTATDIFSKVGEHKSEKS